MQWMILVLAGLCEVGFAACMGRATQLSGPAQWPWWLGFGIFLGLSMLGLWKATSGPAGLPLGVGYAVWTGIGAVGTIVVSALWLKQPLNPWQWFFLATLILSVVGLKLVSGGD